MKKLIFIADFFAEDYIGGAELTTEALIKKSLSKYQIIKKRSGQITEKFIVENKNEKFIVCNFSSLSDENKILLCKNANYQIVEYDYKFCKYRSPEKHLAIENKQCDCSSSDGSKINKIFYGYAKKIWFMSEKQQEIFLDNISVIKKEKSEVLSSIFSDGDLRFINSIKDNEKDENYIILNSNSWIKNTQGCIQYAKKHNLKYELISGLPYHEMLIKLSTSKGLIFQPSGGDTCPRIVIEAKMLGCDIKLNENVQHKNEHWFQTREECYSYMSSRAQYFMENV